MTETREQPNNAARTCSSGSTRSLRSEESAPMTPEDYRYAVHYLLTTIILLFMLPIVLVALGMRLMAKIVQWKNWLDQNQPEVPPDDRPQGQ